MSRKVFWVAVALIGAGVWWHGLRSGQAHLSDFAGYYTASKILTTTDSVGRMYEDRWFEQKMHEFGMSESTLVMYVNPPPVALMMTPLAGLSPRSAKLAWNLVNILLLGVIILLMRRLVPVDGSSLQWPMVVGILACTVPFLRNLQRGQLYVLMLLLLVLFMEGYLHNRRVVAGVSLAALFLLKMFGWIFFVLLLAERRWKELGWTLLFICAGFVLTLPVLGVASYEAHIAVLHDALSRSDFAFTGLPNIPAFFGSMFTFHHAWNPIPLVHVPIVATLLSATCLVLMTGATLRMAPARASHRLFAFTLLAVLFTPLAADHHYTLVLIPLVALLVMTRSPGFDWRLDVLAAIVAFGLVGWYPQPAMSFLPGISKILAFPRLIAACVLWYLLLQKDQLPRPSEGAGGDLVEVHARRKRLPGA